MLATVENNFPHHSVDIAVRQALQNFVAY